MGIKYSSKMSSFDGGEGLLEDEDLDDLSLEECRLLTDGSVFGQFRVVARRTTVH